MPEELTSGLDASPQTPPDGGQSGEATSGEAPQSQQPAPVEATQAPAPSQPQTQQAQKPVNLFELPEFRQYQATQERRATEMQKRLQEYEAQMEQFATANMDDFQKAQWEREKFKRVAAEREQQMASMQQQFEAAQMAAQRQADLTALSQEYGVDASEIAGARTYDEAKFMAQSRQLQKQIEELRQAQRAQTNRPDLGGGRANTPGDRLSADLDKALKNRDAVAYVRLLSEQQAGG